MRSAPMTIAFAGLIFTATCAAAEERQYSVKETRFIAYKYGQCAVRGHTAGASEAIMRNVDNETLVKRYRILINGDCLSAPGSRLMFPGDFYRYALADGLVRRRLADRPVPDLTNVQPLAHAAAPEEPMPPLDDNQIANLLYANALHKAQQAASFRALGIYGECVVRVSPTHAKALLVTEPETAAENDGFKAIQPALAQCMPEGQTMTLDKFVVRGIVAVNYYRLAMTALQSGAQ